ncbi:MAG: endo-1,4-beta-xylanase [Candidatus Dormibacteria bacterium]
MTYDTLAPAPVLTQTPQGDDSTMYAAAAKAAETSHRGHWTLRLTGIDGKPLTVTDLRFQLHRHDFLFGSDIAFNNAQYLTLQQAGFNDADFPNHFVWARTEPTDGGFTGLDAAASAELDRYTGDGFTTVAHNLMWFPPPGYDFEPKWAQDLPFDTFVQRYHDHMVQLVKSVGTKVGIWDIANEPMTNWANAKNLTEEQWQRLVTAGANAVHEAQPGALALVNSYGVKYDGIVHHPVNFMEPLKFYQDMVAQNQPYDITGIELYYNNTWGQVKAGVGGQPYSYENPQLTLSEINGWLDKFAQLKKPMMITEFQANSTTLPDGKPHNTYWGQNWTPELQADYVQAAYTMFYARNDVMGVQYWGHNDGYPVYKGGILTDSDQPREAFNRIKELIAHWSTSGSAKTASDGSLTLDGVAGNYYVDQVGSDGKVVASGTIHLGEGESKDIKLELKAKG